MKKSIADFIEGNTMPGIVREIAMFVAFAPTGRKVEDHFPNVDRDALDAALWLARDAVNYAREQGHSILH